MAAVAENIAKTLHAPEILQGFRGRELTPKTLRLRSGIPSLDAAIGGGLVRGRINEITGRIGCGRTSLAAAFLARATVRGEVAAWIDFAGAFDPMSISAAGVDLARVLWIGCAGPRAIKEREREKIFLKVAELVIETGGFGLMVCDFGPRSLPLMSSAILRIARRAERTGTVVLMLAEHRMCGAFAALTLNLIRGEARFTRPARFAPILFDGLAIEACVARNKLGGTGFTAAFNAQIDPDADDASGVPRPSWAVSHAS
jgi:hypothetical protein